jgi:hypothetical protein
MDIYGPFPIKIVDDFYLFGTFTNDFFYGYIYPIKEWLKGLYKSNISKSKAENQHDLKIKIVRLDHDGKYYGKHTPYG